MYRDNQGRQFGTGLIRSSESERRAFCSVYSGPNIPRDKWAEVDYRAFCPAIYNQGQQGSCVGHGGVASLATIRAMHGLGMDRLSACNLYGQINGGQDRGALVIDALKALRDTGACLESTVGPGKWQPGQWPGGWKAEAARFKIERAEEIRGFDAIVTALLEGDLVCFGIPLGNRFEPDGSGNVPDWDGSEVGGHCMYAAGTVKRDKWRLIVPNSWGEDWGERGHCYMPESYFRSWHEAYRVTVGREDPQGDNPPAARGN